MKPLLQPIILLGSKVNALLEFIGGVTWMLRDTLVSAWSGLVVGRGRRMGWANLWFQMVRVGVKSVPIVSLVVFCIGAILALQMTPVLDTYGARSRVADIIAIAMFRELGPLVAAIVLTGFAGAAIAAELGSMVVGEEIEALESHAISPIRFLVLPRVIATSVMMVCLAVIADLVGVAGGLVVAVGIVGVGFDEYLRYTIEAIDLNDFYTGLIKAGCFGTIIALLACYLGLSVKGGATGVGNATTKTVVYTIVALIAVDLMFTAVFYYLDM